MRNSQFWEEVCVQWERDRGRTYTRSFIYSTNFQDVRITVKIKLKILTINYVYSQLHTEDKEANLCLQAILCLTVMWNCSTELLAYNNYCTLNYSSCCDFNLLGCLIYTILLIRSDKDSSKGECLDTLWMFLSLGIEGAQHNARCLQALLR